MFITSARVSLVGRDLDQRQLALDMARLGEVDHLDDVDQLVELLVDLRQHLVVAARHQGDARHRGSSVSATVRLSMLKPRPLNMPGDARQDAELVLDQNRNGMAHS